MGGLDGPSLEHQFIGGLSAGPRPSPEVSVVQEGAVDPRVGGFVVGDQGGDGQSEISGKFHF